MYKVTFSILCYLQLKRRVLWTTLSDFFNATFLFILQLGTVASHLWSIALMKVTWPMDGYSKWWLWGSDHQRSSIATILLYLR